MGNSFVHGISVWRNGSFTLQQLDVAPESVNIDDILPLRNSCFSLSSLCAFYFLLYFVSFWWHVFLFSDVGVGAFFHSSYHPSPSDLLQFFNMSGEWDPTHCVIQCILI